jgi:hypothetical protein
LEQLVKIAFHYNVHLILFDILKKTRHGAIGQIHSREKLEHEAAAAATLGLINQQDLRTALTRWTNAVYNRCYLRASHLHAPCTGRRRFVQDTDLLVRESDFQLVTHILSELGHSGADPQLIS